MENYNQIIDQLTLVDFQRTKKPYELLYAFQGNPFDRNQLELKLDQRARDVGFKKFKSMYKSYSETQNAKKSTVPTANTTAFNLQPFPLLCGTWNASDDGVYKIDRNGQRVCACVHPIMIVERLVDIDTGQTKVTIAYRQRSEMYWHFQVVEMDTISSVRNITKLSTWGVAVTSNNASSLVSYLHDIINANYETIPIKHCYSRFGFFPEHGFAPFSSNMVFGGTQDNKNMVDAVSSRGDFEAWRKIVLEFRKGPFAAKMMLAASFAAPILSVVGTLPFFVHCWSPASETGKTVSLMVAASVWGNPTPGYYVQSLNATQVGLERLSAFLNHLPVCLDELQLAKDGKGGSKIDVYQLAEGIGRIRGSKYGGNDITLTWRTCFLSTGETPIVELRSGAGAVNRVINIECLPNCKLVSDGRKVVDAVRNNYGLAGRLFIEKLYESNDVLDRVRKMFSENVAALSATGATDKQAMSGAAILTADQLATEWIFQDERQLYVEAVAYFLAQKSDILLGQDGYQYLCNWIGSNQNRFVRDVIIPPYDVYGVIDGDYAWINSEIFRRALADAGYNYQSVINYLKSNRLIQHRGSKGNTKARRIIKGGPPIDCIVLRLPDDQPEPPEDSEFPEIDEAQMPF